LEQLERSECDLDRIAAATRALLRSVASEALKLKEALATILSELQSPRALSARRKLTGYLKYLRQQLNARASDLTQQCSLASALNAKLADASDLFVGDAHRERLERLKTAEQDIRAAVSATVGLIEAIKTAGSTAESASARMSVPTKPTKLAHSQPGLPQLRDRLERLPADLNALAATLRRSTAGSFVSKSP
jgi:hypothetical protein